MPTGHIFSVIGRLDRLCWLGLEDKPVSFHTDDESDLTLEGYVQRTTVVVTRINVQVTYS